MHSEGSRDFIGDRDQGPSLRSDELRISPFELLADIGDDTFWMIDAMTRALLFVSSGYERIWHKSAQIALHRRHEWHAWVHHDDLSTLLKAFDSLLHKGIPLNATYRVQDGQGHQRWVRDRGWPIHGAGGRISAAIGIISDVTSEKVSQERQMLLLREMNHRVKNTLAIVLSIAHQTANTTSLDDFLESFYARVHALSGAHDLMMQNAWTNISLEEVVSRTLAPHIQTYPERIRIEGPTVLLPHDPSVALNLVFHELATNAAKYGSLSRPGGRIAVTWSLKTREGISMLDLRWEESGGPPVAGSTRRGFGSRLIKRTLAGLGGRVEMNFAPSGFYCWIVVPLGSPG